MFDYVKPVDTKTALLMLGACASFIEIGPIIDLIKSGEGLLTVLLVGLSYQLGNAAPHPQALGRVLFLLPLALVAVGLYLLTASSSAVWYASVFILGWVVQYVRRWLGALEGAVRPSTAQKRIARVVGFASVTFLAPVFWLSAVVISLAWAIYLIRHSRPNFGNEQAFKWPPNVVEVTMLLHQMHYFVYCYAVVVLVAVPELGGPAYAGLWFAAGWVSYLSAETLWKRFNPNAVFLIGHACLTAILVLMWLALSWPIATVILWVLSGFGGGSVYCLALMHRNMGLPHSRLETSEDVGHLLGVVVAIVLINIWGDIGLLPLFGGIFAVSAALLMARNIACHFAQQFGKDLDHEN